MSNLYPGHRVSEIYLSPCWRRARGAASGVLLFLGAVVCIAARLTGGMGVQVRLPLWAEPAPGLPPRGLPAPDRHEEPVAQERAERVRGHARDDEARRAPPAPRRRARREAPPRREPAVVARRRPRRAHGRVPAHVRASLGCWRRRWRCGFVVAAHSCVLFSSAMRAEPRPGLSQSWVVPYGL